MYNLLVVDDELYAVKGITQGIDWSEIDISEVFEAFNAEEAKERFTLSAVDIVICDIEMPSSNGLELLEWIKENYPQTETIFVTGHADFSYARRAIHLGSFDYLLKPVNYEELKAVVSRVIQKLIIDRTYKKYSSLFESHKPLMEERFWQEFFANRMSPSETQLEELITKYQLNISSQFSILPILISVELWQKELTVREEEILEYALRNAASELIIKGDQGCVIQDRRGHNIVILYEKHGESMDIEELTRRCESYLSACNQYFYCHLSCYVGTVSTFHNLLKTYVSVLEMERSNVTQSNKVLAQFNQWSQRIVTLGTDILQVEDREKASVIQKIYDYIDEHLQDELSREQIAEYVHFNSAYLSRLFRKETNTSLTDYILEKRMNKAKLLLISTNIKISDVSSLVGYGDIPHFTKMFKRNVGLTPQEFRKSKSKV
ncbi:two-component system response regulator YesN [Paenibacillus sp. V4I3]|uniref:response regulator transcription factor n=1 Tax=unclassified Paenibacillus TaxID=185978 RepID=UPI0027832A6F|nr:MULTISPECIES: response regulator [unclassified Paenibacillus]MDQ0878521.1 two-component system response regulator YesN [Paenibacillus sp. V4I3]MDQ0885619.1 two-component system response regulator YesN [Paenibacillus sp. V4I9]